MLGHTKIALHQTNIFNEIETYATDAAPAGLIDKHHKVECEEPGPDHDELPHGSIILFTAFYTQRTNSNMAVFEPHRVYQIYEGNGIGVPQEMYALRLSLLITIRYQTANRMDLMEKSKISLPYVML